MTEAVMTTEGAAVNEASVAALGRAVRGELLRPGDGRYDEARRLWNARVDKRPALVLRCAGTDDVVAGVRFAREHGIELSVRGGGHSIAGMSLSDGGLTIDLSALTAVEVDPVERVARASAGARLGDLDRATQAFGLATTMGIASDTGIAGLTLGGGYGWLAGLHGLACDNLLSAEVVTSDGRVIRAAGDENPDLFWALRGGGGNFGIVTFFEYALHPVGPVVVGGMALYPPTPETLRFFDEFAAGCPDALSTAGLLLSAPDGTPVFAIVACHAGPLPDAEKALAPLHDFGPPVADMIEPRSYLDMQKLTDEAWPPGRLYHWKSSLVRRLGDEAIETLLEGGRSRPTPLSVIYLQQLHGAAARVGVSETAFPHRFAHFNCGAMLETDDSRDVDGGVEWTRACWEAMQAFTERRNYANDLGHEGEQRVREAFGQNLERLVEVKRAYDPANVFRLNPNIRPDG